MTTTTPPNAPTESEAPERMLFGLPARMFPVAGLGGFDSFAFYGMQTILVYYVYFTVGEGGLGLSVDVAIAIASAYGGSVFLATIFTGWLADRVYGAERGMRWGAVLSIAGYATLALVPGPVGLAAGLIAAALGSAAMWVGEGTIIGSALDGHPTKRNSGFTVYYLLTAGGAMLGITLTGILQSGLGFRIGFAASAIALIVGLAIYLPFRRRTAAIAPQPVEPVRSWRLILPILFVAAAITAVVVAVSTGFNPATIVAGVALVIAGIYFVRFFTSPLVSAPERAGILRYLPFFVATLVFCALYQQLFTTIAVHSESQTDRFIFGIELPPSTVIGIAPLCTIIVAPLLAIMWGKLGARQPSLGAKFAIAFTVCGLALAGLAAASGTGDLTPLIILMLIVFAFGASDVVVSPSGISLATEVAPARFQTQMLSMHYTAVAIGISGSGIFATLYLPGENEPAYFTGLAVTALVVAAGMVVTRVVVGRRTAV